MDPFEGLRFSRLIRSPSAILSDFLHFDEVPNGVNHSPNRGVVRLNHMILMVFESEGAKCVALLSLRPETTLHLTDHELLSHAWPPA